MTDSAYRRPIITIRSQRASLTAPQPGADLRAWLAQAMVEYHLTYLLAHADDGVIWGKRNDNQLELSSDVYREGMLGLHQATMQSARLFGPNAELLLWRNGPAWKARLIRDADGPEVAAIDEAYLMWGTQTHDGDQPGTTFRLLTEGQQGIVHAPPLMAVPHRPSPNTDDAGIACDARLVVRHYLAADEAGVLRIAYSRLVEVCSPESEKGGNP